MIVPITTPEALSVHLAKYRYALIAPEPPEARFILVSDFDDIYLLADRYGYIWVPMQVDNGCIEDRGHPFATIEEALAFPMRTKHMALYYSDNGVERLRWMAEQLTALKAAADPVSL